MYRIMGVIMKASKTMTLNLTEREMEAIEKLAERKGMNKTALVKQALRLYQTVEERLSRGEKVFLEDDKKKTTELILL